MAATHASGSEGDAGPMTGVLPLAFVRGGSGTMVVSVGDDGRVSPVLTAPLAVETATWMAGGDALGIRTKDGVEVVRMTASGGKGVEVAHRVAVENTLASQTSPGGTYVAVLTVRAGDAHNMTIRRVATGEVIWSAVSKSTGGGHPSSWNPCVWTADDQYVARIGRESVTVLDAATMRCVYCTIPAKGVAPGQCWISPSMEPPYTGLTFHPRGAGRPGSIMVWKLTGTMAPGSTPPTCAPVSSKSLEADTATVTFAPDGKHAVVMLKTDSSATSYYGDSFAFVLSMDGKLVKGLDLGKEGPVYDAAWCPTRDMFIAIGGRSPPMATLFTRDGVPTYTFGTGAWNTIIWQPQGRFVVLGGFGNMSGDVTVWDVIKPTKAKQLGAWNASPATSLVWSPTGRTVVTMTTSPRLRVDNGYRLWSYRGARLSATPMELLYDFTFQPSNNAVWLDRPASPTASATTGVDASGGAGSTIAPAAPPPVKMGAYVPPHLRKAGGGAGMSTVSAMMGADSKAAGRIGAPTPPAPLAGLARLPPGAAPDAAASKRRRGRRGKGGGISAEGDSGEEEEAVGGGGALAPPPAPAIELSGDAKKDARKLSKKVKQIEELVEKQAAGQALNAEQLSKIAQLPHLQALLATLPAVEKGDD